MQKITKNHIIASDGMTLVRISNGEPMGKELYLGKTWYVGGVRIDPPIVETADNFSEIADEEAELQQYTYKASNAVEAVVFLYDANLWLGEGKISDEKKLETIAKYGGVSETDYGTLVTEFIRVKYSSDAMEAIVNNYLYEQSVEHVTEWEAMQSFRSVSKELAKDVLRLTATS